MAELNEKLLQPYNPQEAEDAIYRLWESSDFFNPDTCIQKGVTAPDAPSFTVTLPPPNVTGVLHLGHAYEGALQDTVIRFHRMRGKKTLWVPGTDSAAIATQARVEKNIQKEEKKNRHDIGREELVRRVETFAKDHEHIILNQIKKMGASLDWSRYAYTLDEKRYQAVMTAFVRMYEAGLIYRGNRIVNWDPKGQTTISDDEVVHEERTAKLYTFKYSKDFPISISTTRPETKVGDTAVAVHPEDSRYKEYIGKEYDLEFCGTPLHIKIIGDEHVDPEYGTGALGVTPAHSMADWEIADRHDLPRPAVINTYAKMTVDGPLKDKKVSEAREVVVEWLKEQDLLEQEEESPQNISISERTGAVVEPLPLRQWFVAVDKPFTVPYSEMQGINAGDTLTLKEMMRIAVEKGSVAMPQDRFKKIYFHWIDNLHDWCISRQIWFGHRIPVWYRGEETYVGVTPPEGQGWEQDSDVLDTWFSSALWTFSTLGWPDKTDDMQTFHPTSFMSPAYEILPLWVSRMILMSGFHLGQAPFDTVMIHGLVRDKNGKKFSKSLGNGVNPLEMVGQYGADALRMGLLAGTAIGNDVNFDENKVRGYKKFANKIWNIARFTLENTADAPEEKPTLTERDAVWLEGIQNVARTATDHLERYQLHLAAEEIYQWTWYEFADKCLEESKEILAGDDEAAIASRKWLLRYVLKDILKLLHPFMPFVTEELWGIIHNRRDDDTSNLLLIEQWPTTPSQ